MEARRTRAGGGVLNRARCGRPIGVDLPQRLTLSLLGRLLVRIIVHHRLFTGRSLTGRRRRVLLLLRFRRRRCRLAGRGLAGRGLGRRLLLLHRGLVASLVIRATSHQSNGKQQAHGRSDSQQSTLFHKSVPPSESKYKVD
jgi:hypothetical protein